MAQAWCSRGGRPARGAGRRARRRRWPAPCVIWTATWPAWSATAPPAGQPLRQALSLKCVPPLIFAKHAYGNCAADSARAALCRPSDRPHETCQSVWCRLAGRYAPTLIATLLSPHRAVCLHHGKLLCACDAESWRLVFRHSLAQLQDRVEELRPRMPGPGASSHT